MKSFKTSQVKTSIVNECKELFFDEEFADNLDTDIYLLGFNNGVYDIKEKKFRKTKCYDNISFSCQYDFNEETIYLS